MKTRAGAILSAIRIDRSLDRKIGVQLYTGLREIILSGGVQAGERLPASRTLSGELGVSRTTVIDALERLVAEGLLVSRVGSGTYVSDALAGYPHASGTARRVAEPLAEPVLARATRAATRRFAERPRLPHRPRAFVTALPALDRFPMAHWARLSAKHWRTAREDVMGYGDPGGLPRLREAIATHLRASRGIRCDPEQVFVLGGAQQAFSLIAATLLDPGDAVWFENPGAIGARNAFIAQGARLVPVGLDADGLIVSEGLAKAPDFRLAFVTPSHQQPLGRVMSLARRLELLNAARAADALIVEDDYDGDFHFGPQPQPTLESIDAHGRVIYVGTFSKSLFPSLRLGYLLAPDALVDTLSTLSSSTLGGVPTAPQAITASFMEEGLFAAHVRQMRRVYQERHDALLEAAARLPGWIEVRPASGGFHTVAELAPDVDEHVVVERAARRGVVLAPLGRYCLAPLGRRGVVLGFGSVAERGIVAGIDSLAGLDVGRRR